jgi:uncharacterized membrane protein
MREWMWLTLAVLGWGAWPVTQAFATRAMHPMTVQLTNICICAALGPFFYVWMKSSGQVGSLNLPGVLWTLGSTLLAGIAGIAFLFAVKNRPASEVLSYTQTYPALSFVLCAVVLHEQFTVMKVIGAIMLVAGCVVMNR